MTTTCKECAYCTLAVDGKRRPLMECRRFPPQTHIIMIPSGVIGQSPEIARQSAFPNCSVPCGEFTPRDVDDSDGGPDDGLRQVAEAAGNVDLVGKGE